jgi:NDP-sugar pyrophosphorylase family protein
MGTSSIKQAFVLGAGLGTRLRPLTDSLPKPLIPIFQKPLITFALDHLIAAGVESFVINTHKLAEHFDELLVQGDYAGRRVALINEPDLLETGGGIKNAEPLLGNQPFITYSGDLLTDIDVEGLVGEHLRAQNDVTLALRETGLARGIAFQDGRVVDIGEKYGISGTHDFGNVAVWNPEIFRRIPPNRKISFVPILADWIGENGKIGGKVMNEGEWFNIGSRADYLRVQKTILEEQWKPAYLNAAGWPERVHQSAQVAASAKLLGCSVVGADCLVGEEAVLEDTILWPAAQIASRSRLSGCIVRSHQKVAGVHRDADI